MPDFVGRLRFELLKYQRDLGRTGFTPLFLIGAEYFTSNHVRSNETAFHDFVSMLESLAYETPKGNDVVVAKCVEHGQPIASIYTAGQWKPECEAVVDHKGDATHLHAESQYFAANERTIGSLVEGLWKIFEPHMLSGNFSVHNGSYGELNLYDRELVAKCSERLNESV